jgi:release factor glutamine methyltransferase
MLVFFGTSGDLGYLKRLMEDHGFNAIAVAHLEGERDGTRVEYFTFKAT